MPWPFETGEEMLCFLSGYVVQGGSLHKQSLCFPAAGMPGCPCPGYGMAGQKVLFLTVLALELLRRVGGSQPALRSLGAAAACRLDNKKSESWGTLLSGERLDTWICSLLGSLMVGLSGVFPLLVIPLEMGTMLHSEGEWPFSGPENPLEGKETYCLLLEKCLVSCTRYTVSGMESSVTLVLWEDGIHIHLFISFMHLFLTSFSKHSPDLV